MPLILDNSWIAGTIGTIVVAGILAVIAFIMDNRAQIYEIRRESQLMDAQLAGRMDRIADHMLFLDQRTERLTNWIVAMEDFTQKERDSAFDISPGRRGR